MRYLNTDDPVQESYKYRMGTQCPWLVGLAQMSCEAGMAGSDWYGGNVGFVLNDKHIHVNYPLQIKLCRWSRGNNFSKKLSAVI